MYLPACLMGQTGGLSTFLPLIALTSSGSSAVPGEASSTTASEAPSRQKSSQINFSAQASQPVSRREGASPPTALQRMAESCRRLGPARADLPRKREVDGSESGGHAVAIGAGSEVVPRSRSRTGQGSRGGVGSGLGRRRPGLAWHFGRLAQPLENRKGMGM